MEADDSGPFSLTQPLTDANGYPTGSNSMAGQYHMWATTGTSVIPTSANSSSSTGGGGGGGGSLPTHFSPVSPTGHGMYADHLDLHSTQAAVDALSVRLGGPGGEYHSTATTADRLASAGDGYHSVSGAAGSSDSSSRHPASQSNYHDHLVAQSERHLTLDSYHHLPAPSTSTSSSLSSAQQSDRGLSQPDYHPGQQVERMGGQGGSDYHSAQQASRLGQAEYHTAQASDRMTQSEYHLNSNPDRLGPGVGQSDYHPSQATDRLGQADYHLTSPSDRLAQLDYHSGQGERLADYHGMGSERLGQQNVSYHAGQTSDRTLAAQTDYHSSQMDLDAVGMHADFERRHLDVSMLSKDLVDSSQRGSAIDYLTSQTVRDPLASLHRNIAGLQLQRELDLSVGQTVSPSQRSAPSDLASTSYTLDPSTLPHDLSSYNQSQCDLGVAMMSTSDVVVGQATDGGTRSGSGSGISLHAQDLAGINLTAASRDLVDMNSLTRMSTGREDLSRGRDIIQRPREIQRALEALSGLQSASTSVDLTLSGGSSSKTVSRNYPSASRLSSATKRQTVTTSQVAEMRTQNPLSVASASSNSVGAVSFFPSLPSSRDALNIVTGSDESITGPSSRHASSAEFSRQSSGEMSRLRRELTAPYSDLGIHHSLLASSGSVPVQTFKSSLNSIFSGHSDQLLCNDALTSSRERLYEMMKQQQFCDAVLGTTLHSIKVHKAILCSASAYLCGVLSQTCMGKNGGRILTVQFKADIPAASLSAFIDYIYQGRIKLSVKSARDLNIMARCLHMESLKKTSEEMLLAMGLTNDMDLSIPELLLLETLVDKFDKACSASLPVPAPTAPSCDVGVATEPSEAPPPCFEQASQTDQPPAPAALCSSCQCGLGPRDVTDSRELREPRDLKNDGGSSLRLGNVGSLSLVQNGRGGVVGAKPARESNEALLSADLMSLDVPSSHKPHHKKHLASQASKVEAAVAAVSVTSTLSSSLTSPTSCASSTAEAEGNSLSFETAGTSRASSGAVSSSAASVKSAITKPRKRTSTPTPSLVMPLPSPGPQPALPGQTARTIHHSYGTRAASRTPGRCAESINSDPRSPVASKCNQYLSASVSAGAADLQGMMKQCASDTGSEALNQMAKHRGRTKKGRIAAALSEAFNKLPQSAQVACKSSDQTPEAKVSGKPVLEQASHTSLSDQYPGKAASSPALTAVTAPPSTTTTAIIEAKRSAPKAYRKRLIQSVVSSQQLMADKSPEGEAKEKAGVSAAAETGPCEDGSKGVGVEGGGEQSDVCTTEQLRENLHSPLTSKRKKKGKTRRMLLSSPTGSGGVRVRAPPKKRAKMELELEKLMLEEMEEEEEEEEAAAAGGSGGSQRGEGANSATQTEEQTLASSATAASGGPAGQQAAGSGRRIKMPSSRPGKRARWIKNDQLSSLLIELTQKADKLSLEGERLYTCHLCNNQFLLPKRCLSHVLTTHKVPEAEVIDNIIVRQREEAAEKLAEDDTIPENLMCDICGYRSRDSTTYYLHYHKYFKHGVPLPKGWSAFTCDLCGKELYTKFQLKDHKRTHAEKTPFVCEVCGSGFQSRSNLHSHVLHRHKEEKKHPCGQCDRTFKTRTQLAVHERTHSGLRPFSCPQCSYHSTTRGNMRLHLVNRHKINNNTARDIMRDMKPDIDLSLKPLWQQNNSDSGGEKKASSANKKKSGGNTTNLTTNTTTAHSGARTRKDKVGGAVAGEAAVMQPLTFMMGQGKQEMVMDASTMDLYLKNMSEEEAAEHSSLDHHHHHHHGGFGHHDGSGNGPQVVAKAPEKREIGDSDILESSSSVILSGDSGASIVTLQAADALPMIPGIGVCADSGTAVTFLPPGLETVFHHHHPHHHQSHSEVSVTTGLFPPPPSSSTSVVVSDINAAAIASSATAPASSSVATTIIVPENFLLQHQAAGLQPHSHKHSLYAHTPQSHITSFVVPTLQTLSASDLVVSAATAAALKPNGLKTEDVGPGVMDLADVEVGVIDSTLVPGAEGEVSVSEVTLHHHHHHHHPHNQQHGLCTGVGIGVGGGLGSGDLNLQVSGAAGVAAAVQHHHQHHQHHQQQNAEAELAVSTSEASGTEPLYMQHSPISPAPPVSPAPVYVAVTPTPMKPDLDIQEVGGAGVVLDQSQQGHPVHQYDASLLQAYYPSQFYS